MRADPIDVCAPVPAAGNVNHAETEAIETERLGIVGKCVGLYKPGAVTVFLYDSPARAREAVAEHGRVTSAAPPDRPDAPHPTAQAFGGVGESAVVVSKEQTPPGNEDSPVLYQIVFSRGCWLVYANGGGVFANYVLPGGQRDWEARKQWVRTVTAEVDGKIQAGPLCPESAGAGVTPPARDELGVSLSCQHHFSDPRLVVCTASAANPSPGGRVEYEWSFDGTAQTSRDAELRLTDVAPGSHSVTVTGRDVSNGLTAAPQSVSFVKEGTAGGDGLTPGSPTGSNVPWGWIAIGVGVVGITGWGVNRARGGGVGPLGAPMPPKGMNPPAMPSPSTSRPSSPPERLKPPVPGSSRRPSAPPEQAVPPRPAKPPEQRDRGEEIWLEVDRPAVEVHGDGTDEALVRIVARKRVNGAVVDATSEVRTSAAVSGSSGSAGVRKITVRAPSLPTIAILGRHAGNTGFRGQVTVTGTTVTGKPLTPAHVDVTIRPVRLEIRIKVSKDGFLEQEIVATLPSLCEKVMGKVLGPADAPVVQAADRGGAMLDALRAKAWRPEPSTAERPVAFARCEATIRVDGGESGRPVFTRTAADGRFGFQLPARMIQAYGADTPAYALPATVELGLDATVNRALYFFNVAIDDYGRELTAVPPEAAISHTHRLCAAYPQELLTELRRREEVDFLRLVSALQRLRAAVQFATKYRKDMRRQRQLFEMAAYDSFGSLVDVLTDIVPIAGAVQKWFAGESLTWRIGQRYVTLLSFGDILRGLRNRIGRSLVLTVVAGGLLLTLESVKPLLLLARSLLARLLEGQSAAATKAGLTTEHVDRLAEWRLAAPELDASTSDDAGSAVANGLGSILYEVVELGVKATACAFHVLLLGAAAALLLLGKGLKVMDWGPAIHGVEEAVGEVLEKYISDFSNSIYGKGGALVDSLLGSTLLPPDKARAKKNACDLILDGMASVEDLDRKCATALEDAWQRSHDLDVGEEWQSTISRVARRESEEMARWQSLDAVDQLLDSSAPFLKLFAKLAQAVLLVWAALGAGIVGVPMLLLKLGSGGAAPAAPAVWTPTDALDFAGTIEKAVDLLDFAAVRLPILLKEAIALACVYNLAAVRIRHLYTAI